MKYTVIWREDAEATATQLWTDAETRIEREAISEAVNRIDATLHQTPYDGESRSSASERLLWIQPIAVMYDVIEGDGKVEVIKVWRA